MKLELFTGSPPTGVSIPPLGIDFSDPHSPPLFFLIPFFPVFFSFAYVLRRGAFFRVFLRFPSFRWAFSGCSPPSFVLHEPLDEERSPDFPPSRDSFFFRLFPPILYKGPSVDGSSSRTVSTSLAFFTRTVVLFLSPPATFSLYGLPTP